MTMLLPSKQKATLGAVPLLVALTAGCSVGQGSGDVKSNALYAHQCWGTPPTSSNPTVAVGWPYDMQPDFFAANPYMSQLQIRVQRGSDLTEVSDGLAVQVDDVNLIRNAIANPSSADGGTLPADAGVADAGGSSGGSGGGVKWRVTMPVGVHPPGSGTVPPPGFVSPVHMALYLERSCHNQNIVLYGVDGYVTFNALFDGDPNETSAANKLTDATFDVQFGDISDVPEGAYAGDVPAGLQSRVTGNFRFYFERGQPAQPFP
jgi:hypothetical protein